MNIKIILLKILAVSVIITHLNSCGFYRPVDAREFPPEPEKRIQKNLQEGRGFKLMDPNKNKGGDFDFASSNEMWRATVDTLDFVPLINASYSGGIIITDWFNGGVNNSDNNRDLKITVKFLSNDIRSDALDVDIHERICNAQNISCTVSLIDSKISNDIKIAILKKAAFLEKNKVEKIVKENKKKRPKKSD